MNRKKDSPHPQHFPAQSPGRLWTKGLGHRSSCLYLNSWSVKSTGKGRRRQNNSGQIILEYVLLLIVAVMIAALLTRGLVSRSQGSEGAIIKAWDATLKQIGSDKADSPEAP